MTAEKENPYRIPADPEALHGEGHGVFAPPPAADTSCDHHQTLREMIRSYARAIDRDDL